MLLYSDVDDFLLAASSEGIAHHFEKYCSKHHKCHFGLAEEFVGFYIVLDCGHSIYLSQSALIDRLLEQEFAGITCSEGVSGNTLCYSPGQWGTINNWEHFCPRSTPFDYKMPDISPDDCCCPCSCSLDASGSWDPHVYSEYTSGSFSLCASAC